MDNFDLRKYLAEGKLFEQEYPELISFLNANVEDVKQHMRDYFLDDEEEADYNDFISKEIDQVKSFQDVGKNKEDSEEYNIVGAVVSQDEGDVGITYMFKDDYDALEDKTKFENDFGYPPQDVKIAGKDLKFFTFTI
jgi:hypothetical protein